MHENEPSPSNQPERATSEQIPHSGIHHDERPVAEFDNTPLPEAVERGLVNPTPDTPAGLEQADPAEKKSHKKLVIGGAAFLAGAALVAGSVIGIKAAGDAPKNTPPTPDPKATSQTPEATPTPSSAPEQQLTVESLLIPDTMAGEDAAKMLVEQRLTAWFQAGESSRLQKDWFAQGGGLSLPKSIAATNAQVFTDALFIPGWQQKDALVKLEQFQEQANISSLETWLITNGSGNPADLEPYKRSMAVDTVRFIGKTDTSVLLEVDVTEHENSDKNRAVQLDPNHYTAEGNRLTGALELDKVNGSWKISHLTWQARN